MSAARTIVARRSSGSVPRPELLDHGVEGAGLAAMAPEHVLDVEGAAPNRPPRPATSAGATNRNTASGSTKRRISQGQAMRSILGRARVTQTVRPRLSRGGSLAAGTSGRPACFQASKPPARASAGTPSCRSQAATPFAQLLPRWQTTTAARPDEVSGPFRCRAMRAAHRARDQAGIGREILLGANVDDRRALRRADQADELSMAIVVIDDMLRPPCLVGRDSSACRLVGRSLPHGII